MSDSVRRLQDRLLSRYGPDPFVSMLGIEIHAVSPGRSELRLDVLPKHTNLFDIAHGGVFLSLADTAMGVACVTLDKMVVTLEMNMNFVRSAGIGETLRGIATVIHNGRTTMVVECDVQNSKGELLARGRGTFIVVAGGANGR